MKRRNGNHALEMLSRNLAYFFPDLKGHFMCPTCLTKIPLKNRREITVAHIVPKAAGGRLKTYLCRRCNNSFGARQDKWFGEFIRLASDSRLSIFSTAIQDGYFEIDGHHVNGHWWLESEKSFAFCVDDRRNSPAIIKLMDHKFSGTPPKIELKIPLPILRNEAFIRVGFLTAGYLYWFAVFGYSWILQKHLDPIRKQICSPDKNIITAKYFAQIDVNTLDPWIAFIPVGSKPLVAFGYLKNLIIFPPRYEPDLYSKLATIKENINLRKIRSFNWPFRPAYGKPLIILQDHFVMILPELGEKREPPECLQFCGDEDKPKRLRSISHEEFDRMGKIPGTVVHHYKL